VSAHCDTLARSSLPSKFAKSLSAIMLPVRAATAALQRARMQGATAAKRQCAVFSQFDDVSPNNGAPRIPSPWNKWFPHERIPCSPQLAPYKVNVEAGQEYFWCACGECNNQPFCDDAGGAGGCASRGFKALSYISPVGGTRMFCGCKKCPQAPIYMGTCTLVWADVNIVQACASVFGLTFLGGVFLTWNVHP